MYQTLLERKTQRAWLLYGAGIDGLPTRDRLGADWAWLWRTTGALVRHPIAAGILLLTLP